MLHTRGHIFKLFQIVIVIAHGDILRSMALVLGVNRLLALAKDFGVLCPIAVNEVFSWFISRSIELQLQGSFQEHYPHVNLEYQPLEDVKPSFLASKPSSTYTLIGSWCKSTSKTFLITFFELLFLKNYEMSGDFWQALSFLPSCFMVLIFLFSITMGNMMRESPLLSHFQAWGKVTP